MSAAEEVKPVLDDKWFAEATPHRAIRTRTAAQERHAITAYIRKRIASVANLAKHGRLTEADAHRLRRWLGALADDIDAQLFDDEAEG